jgi:glycerophosphoryl diester phosphodiesterase
MWTSLLYRLIAFVALWPAAGILLRLVIATSGEQVVADADIIGIVLSPVGFGGLLLAGAVLITVLVLEQVCLLLVACTAAPNRRVHTLSALWVGLTQSLPVLKTVLRILLWIAAVSAPFLIVAAVVYFTLLTRYDINFYLSNWPREFVLAVCIGVVLVLALFATLLPRAVGWMCALPLLLFESARPATVLSISSQRMKGGRATTCWLLLVWGAAAIAAGSLNLTVVVLLAKVLVPLAGGALTVLVVMLGLLAMLLTLGNIAISILQATTFGVCMAEIYRARTHPAPQGLEKLLAPVTEAETWRGISRRSFVWLTVGVFVASAATGAYLLSSLQIDDEVIVIAHRGAAGSAPENTMASVRQALADGADVVEIDVQETADGEVVVIHDSDFMKIAGVDLKVWDATMEDLRGIDIGSHFDPQFSDQRVPTLKQVLETCRGKAVVDIELKYYGHDEQLEQRVADIVESVQMQDGVILMSLKYDAVQKMKRLRPDWTVGLLTAQALGDLTTREADFLAVNAAMFSFGLARQAHKAGQQVYVWTINDAVDVARYASLGADGVITDFPAMARQVLEARKSMTPIERALVNLAFRFGIVPASALPR